MRKFLITVIESDGRHYTIGAIAADCGGACLMVLDSIGRIVNIAGRPVE